MLLGDVGTHGVTSLDAELAYGALLTAFWIHREDMLVVSPSLYGIDAGLEVLCHGVLGRPVPSAEVALPEPCEFSPTAIDRELECHESLVRLPKYEVQALLPGFLLVVIVCRTRLLANQSCTLNQMNFSTSSFPGIKVTFCLQ